MEADFLSRNKVDHWEFMLEKFVFNMVLECEANFGCYCLQGHSSASLLLLLNGSPLFGSPGGYEFCVTVVALKWLV